MAKTRATVTLDEELIEAARACVLEGRADSVSALVEEALRTRLESDARLRALGEAVAGYEAEHGAFTQAEMTELERRDRAAADAQRARARKAG